MSDDWGTMPGERDRDIDGQVDTCDECGAALDSGSQYVHPPDAEDAWPPFMGVWLCHACAQKRNT